MGEMLLECTRIDKDGVACGLSVFNPFLCSFEAYYRLLQLLLISLNV
jgi:hypothetical protein